MNPPDPASIPLRDIHLPEPVGWWPLAPGWWVVAGLVAIIAAAGLWLLLRRRRSRAQRAALAALNRIEARYEEHGDAHACARELSALLRRLALACDKNQAAVTGDQWLAHLQDLAPLELQQPQATALLTAPYSPRAAAGLSNDDVAALLALLRQWIPATVRYRASRTVAAA